MSDYLNTISHFSWGKTAKKAFLLSDDLMCFYYSDPWQCAHVLLLEEICIGMQSHTYWIIPNTLQSHMYRTPILPHHTMVQLPHPYKLASTTWQTVKIIQVIYCETCQRETASLQSPLTFDLLLRF